MKIKSVNLEKVIGVTSAVPQMSKIEVAFAGKSNVGKSSLINTLIARKAYARVSERPGKTQTINYYRVNADVSYDDVRLRDMAPDCYLVDLPGYGYAKTTLEEKEKWGRMIENYLHESGQLSMVFLLVDIRHEPSENDKMMYRWIISNGKKPIIIATKKDKIKRSQLDKSLNMIRTALRVTEDTPVIPFSALNKEGMDDVWRLIADV